MKKLSYKEPIYTYQIDFVGHVNNIVYIQWLENARIKLLQAMGLSITQIAEEDKLMPVISETKIKYIKPFFLHNEVYVEAWVSKLFNVYAVFEIQFFNENKELCASSRQKVLFIDQDTQRASRKIIKYRDDFKKFLLEE